MSPLPLRVGGAVRLAGTVPAGALAACLAAAGCGQGHPPAYQGYAEGEFVLVAAPSAGRLEKRFVQRGESVEAGAPLFTLEQENEKAARSEAQSRLDNAQARLANLSAARRLPEIDALRAQQRQAIAARTLSAEQLRQQEKLYSQKFISLAGLEAARALYDRDTGRLAETEAQLRNAGLAIGREQEIGAAHADVEAGRAVLAQSDWRLGQRAVRAPAKASVQDTFYAEGEWLQAGSPVVSLLPAGAVKLRFFVPETALAGIAPGLAVRVTCDGCSAPIKARVNYVSRQAEYTPPVIYSREQRARLVYLVEARPEPQDAPLLKPGQLVDILLP